MKIIPLRAVPNQRFTFSNGQDRWVIEIKVAITSMICNIWLNDEPVLLGSRIVAGVPIIWSPRLATDGNLGILTEGGEEPWWEQFGTSQQLVFWESDMAIASTRFVDFRSRNISPSLTELTALVNTAMRIEDIGYYPPSWEALQEAISYAVSVVRSHAPEQGQILLATQILTSAMGGLIEWLSIDFAAGGWDEYLVFSRASTATYWGPSRTLLEAAVDGARIQHDPVTGEPLGLLVESEATNALVPNTGPLPVPNAQTFSYVDPRFPDPATRVVGGMDVVAGSAAGTFYNFGIEYPGGSDDTDKASYVYVKSGACRYFCMSTGGVSVNNPRFVDFDNLAFSDDVEDAGLGWVKVKMFSPEGGFTGSRRVRFWFGNEIEGDTIRMRPGDECILIYPSMFSGQGEAAVGSSIIPTSDSPVTRAADNCSIDIGEAFNPVEGTFKITAQVREGEVVATLGGIDILSDSDELKEYTLIHGDIVSGSELTLGDGIFERVEYFPEVLV